MIEARTRFTQLIRLAHLNQQTVTVTEAGRPLAVIAPISAERASATAPPNNTQAGWARRIEQVRADVRRQHQSRIRELENALDQAWKALDALRPAGTDRDLDALRVVQADLRRPT